MPFVIAATQLSGILAALSIPKASEKLFLLGVRGATPRSPVQKGTSLSLDGSKLTNNVNHRCTIAQWWPEEGLVAAYNATTVPTARYVDAAADRGGRGCNQMFPQLCTFQRGPHGIGRSTEHPALRELSPKLICRTSDDGDYEPETDIVQIDSPCDNNHASFGEDTFSSAGCQTIAGKPGEGEWAVYKKRAYDVAEFGQNVYRYLLLPADTWKSLAIEPSPRILIGSQGDRAKAVQERLISLDLLAGPADGIFGPKSGLALLRFQRKRSDLAADAICGAATAKALGVKGW